MFLKIGHRGAKAYEPENTIRSFKKALELGANSIEIDARTTKDKKIVCLHDEYLERTTNGKGLVREKMLKEIKELNAGKGEKVPTLEEALEFIDGKAIILIDLREDEIVEDVIEILKSFNLVKSSILISSDAEILKHAKEIENKIKTGMWFVRFKDHLKIALKINLDYLKPIFFACHSWLIEKAHSEEIKVLTWVVNDKERAKELIKKGVDGIVTDKPDILKDLL